jgi:hypothetical protein
MPIGSSKLGVLGAGLVPGGTETFNAPGTFSIPPGVKKVPNTTASPGSAGTGGGAGSSGNRQTAPPGGFPFPGCGSVAYGGGGGGGAGAVNSGATGQIGTSPSIYAAGGTGNVTAPVPPAIPGQFPGLGTSTQGGSGGGTSGIHGRGGLNISLISCPSDRNYCMFGGGCQGRFQAPASNRNTTNQFSPPTNVQEIFRAGGGGGAGAQTLQHLTAYL